VCFVKGFRKMCLWIDEGCLAVAQFLSLFFTLKEIWKVKCRWNLERLWGHHMALKGEDNGKEGTKT
jgi:hypothetical protein